ncbi:MAG: DUF4416 family protein, partial [Candidatus Coatesbacteria bacterium]
SRVFNPAFIYRIVRWIMAEPGPPRNVLPFVGFLTSPEADVSAVVERVSSALFALDEPAGPFPFGYTGYYEPEMGAGLKRYWALGTAFVEPDELVELKLKANELEGEFAAGGRRRINIDPGYISENAVVAATYKALPAAVYLARGVYGYLLFLYRSGTFEPVEWTYPDYRDYVGFFNAGRKALLSLVRTG